MGTGTLEINKAKYGAKKCCELLKIPKAKKKKANCGFLVKEKMRNMKLETVAMQTLHRV